MMFKSFLPSGFIIAGFLKKDEPKNVQQKTAHLETEAEWVWEISKPQC